MYSDKTILIIDDDKRYSELLSEELQDEGYKTIYTENGAEAIRILTTFRPDIIILDIEMPIMNGIEALGPIVCLQKDVPVILHSSYPDFKADLKRWQADACLIKSSDFSALKKEVRKLLGKNKHCPAEISSP
jgi:CheY-like chemotaxis protein